MDGLSWIPEKFPSALPDAQKLALAGARHSFLEDERLDDAIAQLEVFGANRHPRLSRYLARLYFAAGDDLAAARMMTSNIRYIFEPGQWGFSVAGTDHSRVIAAPAHALVFFPIPKSGSTSLTNLFAALNGNDPRGEHVLEDHSQYKMVSRADLHETRPALRSLACVRDPLVRLQSFYQGNIVERDHLAVHAPGKASFFGLDLKPDFQTFIDNLDVYKRFFMTVWHHAAPTTTFLGTAPERISDIVSMSELDALIRATRDQHGLPALPPKRDMARSAQALPAYTDAQRSDLTAAYAQDYHLFGSWF